MAAIRGQHDGRKRNKRFFLRMVTLAISKTPGALKCRLCLGEEQEWCSVSTGLHGRC